MKIDIDKVTIKELRKATGLTQEELGNKLNISRFSVLKNEKTELGYNKIIKLAILGVCYNEGISIQGKV